MAEYNSSYTGLQIDDAVGKSLDALPVDNTLSTTGKAADAKKTGDEIGNLKSALDTINNFLEINQDDLLLLDGFAADASNRAAPSTSPFVIPKLFDHPQTLVNKIKLNCVTVGTLSIGVIKNVDATVGQTVDMTKAVVKDTLTITQTGIQEIALNTPFNVNPDEYIFVCIPTDTCVFSYGGASEEKEFNYNRNGSWYHSFRSIGINLYGNFNHVPENIRDIIESTYNGKTLSILGDSISTFAGYIPEGNATYYPAGTVTTVADTWWYKLMSALGMTLEVNNSWSGSKVTTTSGEASAGCMTRCQNLGNAPDVIIVWMGINDFNYEVQLGTYDGSTAIPADTTTFREAYGIMLDKILTAYPTSEVFVCTLPQCERNGTSGFPEINGNNVALTQFNRAIRDLADAFGVKVLEHNKCGLTYQNMPTYNPDNLHPNKYGHSLIANNDIWQLDGTIAKRYPLS